jgi:hypothetical protein
MLKISSVLYTNGLSFIIYLMLIDNIKFQKQKFPDQNI